jgi:hypothetical protein
LNSTSVALAAGPGAPPSLQRQLTPPRRLGAGVPTLTEAAS